MISHEDFWVNENTGRFVVLQMST